MPFRDDLLNPVPGDNPSGVSLWHDPIYAKLREARREDRDVATGDYAKEVKLGDWKQVIKVGGEVLATRSKDLQIAVWLTEAHLRTEGFAGLRQGLDLLRNLITTFWGTLYPKDEEDEGGYMELLAAPLDWLGTYLDREPFPLKLVPLTKNGINWLKYQESRKVGYEGDGNETKQQARIAAIAEGKIPAEEFDKGFTGTSKAYYVELQETLDGCLEQLEALNETCQEKFTDFAPSFSALRTAIEEIRNTVKQLLNKKRELEPDEAAPGEAGEEGAGEAAAEQYAEAGGAAPAVTRGRKVAGLEPADIPEAWLRIAAVAKFLRTQEPYSPAPYLLLRGLRWGELRAGGETPDPRLLEAPPADTRQNLKRLALDSNWQEVLETAEGAMALACGRGWLDLQRYTVRACTELGFYYEPIAKAVKSGVRALVTDIPALPDWTLMDDTPTANQETRQWLHDEVLAGSSATAAPGQPAADENLPATMTALAPAEPGAPAAPDVYELAMLEARNGKKREAIEILTREIGHERSGRGRFQRRMQLAQVCMATGYDALAVPILEELATEIERRRLDEWEASDVVAHPLALLYRSLGKVDGNAEQRQKLYAQICRLDPLQALAVGR